MVTQFAPSVNKRANQSLGLVETTAGKAVAVFLVFFRSGNGMK
jgi:hypothetical protein